MDKGSGQGQRTRTRAKTDRLRDPYKDLSLIDYTSYFAKEQRHYLVTCKETGDWMGAFTCPARDMQQLARREIPRILEECHAPLDTPVLVYRCMGEMQVIACDEGGDV